MKVTYVSQWADGTCITTSCFYHPGTETVIDIEMAEDVHSLDLLLEEYIELPDGTIIRNFTTEDGRTVVDGQAEV